MSTDTPRTDAVLLTVAQRTGNYLPEQVTADFARTLEGELAAKDKEIARLQSKWEGDEPGQPGRMYRGLLKLIADLADSHGSSRPASCFVQDMADKLAAKDRALKVVLVWIETRDRLDTIDEFDSPHNYQSARRQFEEADNALATIKKELK